MKHLLNKSVLERFILELREEETPLVSSSFGQVHIHRFCAPSGIKYLPGILLL